MTWFDLVKEEINVYVGIDSPPGQSRPDEYIGYVMEGLVPEAEIGETVSRFFGAWIWHFTVEESAWEKHRPIIKERMVSLVEGPENVRGGKWGRLT